MSDDDGFLTRWSRRKSAAKPTAGEPPAAAAEPPPPQERAEEPADERTDDEILADLGLPHPDEMNPGEDIKGFLQAAVPARLRRAALRRYWRSDPVLANLDGLIDYGEDFTDSATVVENLQTAYRVGRGFWEEDDEADERAGEEEERPGAGPAQGDAEDVAKAENAPEAESDEAGPPAPEPADQGEAPEPDEAPIVATRRRMVFR